MPNKFDYQRKRSDGFTEGYNRGNYSGGYTRESTGTQYYDKSGNPSGYRDNSGNRYDKSGNLKYKK